MIVDVTQSHIDQGKAGDCSACPIALALKELIPDNFSVSVKFTVAHIVSHTYNTFRTIPLPKSAIEFIMDFDKHFPMSPFKFEVDLVLPSSIDDGHQFDKVEQHWYDESKVEPFPV